LPCKLKVGALRTRLWALQQSQVLGGLLHVGCITIWNKKAAQITGRSKEEVSHHRSALQPFSGLELIARHK
jgi:hypothetical protein